MPFTLTEEQRRALSTRLMPQPPLDVPPVELARMRAAMRRRIEGIEAGDLVRLEALLLLAEQGNELAKRLYTASCEHFDITPRSYFGPHHR